MISLAALCSTGKHYGRRFAYVATLKRQAPSLIGPPADELWIIDAIKSEDGRRCEAATGVGCASILIRCSEDFRGCFHCGNASVFLCDCKSGHLCCASGDWEKSYQAPCCGRIGRATISGLAISPVTRPSPQVAALLQTPAD